VSTITEKKDKVRQISGKRKTYHIRNLVTETGTRIDDPRKMVDKLAMQFAKTIVTHKSSEKKDQKEKEPIQVDYGNEEPYNSTLTEEEMDEALAGCAGSSPGLDHIHYEKS
jgi:hypothetical protein